MAVVGCAVVALAADTKAPPKLDPKTSAVAELTIRFDEAGWGPNDAAALTVYSIKRHFGVDVGEFVPSEPYDDGVDQPNVIVS